MRRILKSVGILPVQRLKYQLPLSSAQQSMHITNPRTFSLSRPTRRNETSNGGMSKEINLDEVDVVTSARRLATVLLPRLSTPPLDYSRKPTVNHNCAQRPIEQPWPIQNQRLPWT